jgi:EpsI family protein
MRDMSRRFVLLLVTFAVAAAAVAMADRRELPPARRSFAEFPMRVGDWQGRQEAAFEANVLKVLGVEDYLTRSYVSNRQIVGLYIGYWDSQRQGDTIHSPLNCLPGSGWEPISKATVMLKDPTRPGVQWPANRFVIEKGRERQLVLYWYQAHGRIVASEYWGKFYLVADAVRLNRTDGSIVRIVVPIADTAPATEQAASATAMTFADVLLPQLDPFLPR